VPKISTSAPLAALLTRVDPNQRTQLAADTVGAAQRQLPPELRGLARGVAVHYERRPGPDVLRDGFPPDILGLFTGSGHGQELAADQPAPPQILLYLDNLWEWAGEDQETFREEVRITYLHELGHYLGWDEDELAARGLD
jgi:predicted Zn-dependent protease with MMP-like domain